MSEEINMNTISREAAIRTVFKMCDVCDTYDILDYRDLLVEAFKMLPSAQPEIKPIDYSDCSNAMLKMWMDDVVTDGEYYRIMDKLNKFELKRREESDRKDDMC